MQTKLSLISDVEALTLGSRFLNFEDKKKMLYRLPQMNEDQLIRLREVFMQEQEEWKRIDDMEKTAWNGLATSLNAIVA